MSHNDFTHDVLSVIAQLFREHEHYNHTVDTLGSTTVAEAIFSQSVSVPPSTVLQGQVQLRSHV